MPVYPGISARLTNEQLWAIVCADPAVTNRQLAAQLGAAVGTVTDARRRLRRHGRRRAISHVDCKPAAVRVRRRDANRRRWDALPVEVRRDHLAHVRDFEEEHQDTTQATASQGHARWTDADDAVLIARTDTPAPVLAA